MMKKRLMPLAAVAILAISAIAAGSTETVAKDAQSHYALVQTTLEQHILPHFAALRTAAAQLPEDVASTCRTGDDGAREKLTTGFRNTVLAWAGVSFVRFGPMSVDSRRERLSFWPDPRGIVNRQLRQVLASSDMAVADSITKQSAAVQGLPALEVLIEDRDVPLGPAPQSVFRCKLAEAIAVNISHIAEDIDTDWTKPGGWKDKMLRPGSDNEIYKEPQDAASELVKTLLTGFQLIADSEIKPQVEKKRGFDGPYAKANLSKAYYAAGITSLDKLYQVMGLENFLDEDKDWVKNWAGGAWRTLRESDGAGGAAAGVPKQYAPSLRKVFDMLTGIRKLVVGEMSQAAGLAVGFNELDGD